MFICTEVNCSFIDHLNSLTEFCQNIIHACIDSSGKCIPKTESCGNQSMIKAGTV